MYDYANTHVYAIMPPNTVALVMETMTRILMMMMMMVILILMMMITMIMEAEDESKTSAKEASRLTGVGEDGGDESDLFIMPS